MLENHKAIHRRLMMHPAMTEAIETRGFVFDMLEDPDDNNAGCLIELKEFGAMSGCGSCLFHLLDDANCCMVWRKLSHSVSLYDSHAPCPGITFT